MSLEDIMSRARDAGLKKVPEAADKVFDSAIDRVEEHAARVLPDSEKAHGEAVVKALREASGDMSGVTSGEIKALSRRVFGRIEERDLSGLDDMDFDERNLLIMEAMREGLDSADARVARSKAFREALKKAGAAAPALLKILGWLITVL